MSKTRKDKLVELWKALFNTDIPEETKLEVKKLVDGKEVKFLESFVVGAGVVTEPDGQPLADGEYELEDGTKFTVVDGFVDSITPMEDTKPVEDAPVEDKTEARMLAMEKKIEEMNTLMSGLVEKFSAIETSITASTEKFSAVEVRLEKIEKIPTVTPVTRKVIASTAHTKADNQIENTDDIAERGKALIESLTNKNKNK